MSSGRSGAPLRFLFLSAVSFGTNLGLTAVLHEILGLSPDLAFALGLVTAFVLNFIGMRWWVFPGSERTLANQLAGFALTSLVARGSEYGVFLLLHHLAGVYYLAAAAGTLMLSVVIKYFVYGSWLFAAQEG